jgi:hypothetical protein
LSLFDEANHEKEQTVAGRRIDDVTDHPSTNVEAKPRKDGTRDDSADDSDDGFADAAEGGFLQDQAGEGTNEQP